MPDIIPQEIATSITKACSITLKRVNNPVAGKLVLQKAGARPTNYFEKGSSLDEMTEFREKF